MPRPTRFTPTPVGNMKAPATGVGVATVHPHACGEYTDCPKLGVAATGSPPRLWGIFVDAIDSPALRPVHPHACGEYPQ